MVQVFHASMHGGTPSGILSFWGDLDTAVERAESLFMNHGGWRAYQDGRFLLVDPASGSVCGTEKLQETLGKFADFVSSVHLQSYEIDVQNPLRLYDCWEDDPIGSGAMRIFNNASGLTAAQMSELKTLFSPFEDVIYPQHLGLYMTSQDLQNLYRESQTDAVFMGELEKRRVRSESMGIPFAHAAPQEIVWTSLTVKLRNWALENGFDSFVYEGRHEGKNLDSYVTLKDEQVAVGSKRLAFDRARFMRDASPRFEAFLAAAGPEELSNTSIFWAGTNPTEYWVEALSP